MKKYFLIFVLIFMFGCAGMETFNFGFNKDEEGNIGGQLQGENEDGSTFGGNLQSSDGIVNFGVSKEAAPVPAPAP